MYTGNKENAPERNKTVESRQRKVTRKDVAEEAGVSETIVSYVLNKNRYVKEEKRQRVLEAVEKLQYQPNNIARALHGKGSLQILFIAEELSSGYFSEMVSQMSRDAYRQGYMISLCKPYSQQTVRWSVCQCIRCNRQSTETSGKVRDSYGTVFKPGD